MRLFVDSDSEASLAPSSAATPNLAPLDRNVVIVNNPRNSQYSSGVAASAPAPAPAAAGGFSSVEQSRRNPNQRDRVHRHHHHHHHSRQGVEEAVAPAVQRYFKDRGGIQFDRSSVFIVPQQQDPLVGDINDIISSKNANENSSGGGGGVASLEGFGGGQQQPALVVLPPLPLPPRPIISAVAVDVAAPLMGLVHSQCGGGAGGDPSRVLSLRRLSPAAAAREAGLRPVSTGGAGTTSVDILNAQYVPVVAVTVPSRRSSPSQHQQQQQYHPMKVTGTTPSSSELLAESSAAAGTSSVSPLSKGDGHGASPGDTAGSTPDTHINGNDNSTVTVRHPAATAASAASSDSSGDEDDEEYWERAWAHLDGHNSKANNTNMIDGGYNDDDDGNRLSREAIAAHSVLTAAAGTTTAMMAGVHSHPSHPAGVSGGDFHPPPLRAHLYVEEDSGVFLSHEDHARRTAQQRVADAERATAEARLRRRAWRRARRHGGVSHSKSNSNSNKDGEVDGGAYHYSSSYVDPDQYRRIGLVVVQYCRRLGVFLAALAAGAAFLTLVAATLPTVRLCMSWLPWSSSSLNDSNDSDNNNSTQCALLVDNLTAVALAVRLFDAPLFIFLSLLLVICALVPLVWGCADAEWRRQLRWEQQYQEQQEQPDDVGDGGGDGFLAYDRSRNHPNRWHHHHQNQHQPLADSGGGGGGGKAHDTTNDPTATAAKSGGYDFDPTVAAQLSRRAFDTKTRETAERRAAAETAAARPSALSYFSRLKQQKPPPLTQQQRQQHLGASAYLGATLYGGTATTAGGSDGISAANLFLESTGNYNNTTLGGGGRSPFSHTWGQRLAGTTTTTTTGGNEPPSVSFAAATMGGGGTTTTSSAGTMAPTGSSGALSRQQHQQRLEYNTSGVGVGVGWQQPGNPRGGGGGLLRALRSSEDFYLSGGLLGATNAIAAAFHRAARRGAWAVFGCRCTRDDNNSTLTDDVENGGGGGGQGRRLNNSSNSRSGGGDGCVTRQIEALVQPRLWCLVACLALSVVELSLTDERGTREMLLLVSRHGTTMSTTEGKGAVRAALIGGGGIDLGFIVSGLDGFVAGSYPVGALGFDPSSAGGNSTGIIILSDSSYDGGATASASEDEGEQSMAVTDDDIDGSVAAAPDTATATATAAVMAIARPLLVNLGSGYLDGEMPAHAVRTALLAVFAARAALLLLVWLLDTFF